MAQDDMPRPVPELVVRGALAAYLDGRISLGDLTEWLMDTCGGRRAALAPDLACRIVARVGRHLDALREDLRELYREATREGD